MVIKELPSGMKTYPAGMEVNIRRYTIGELKENAGVQQTPKERYEYVLSGISCPIDKMDLSLFDVNFLGIQRKILTFNQNSFRFRSYCNKCGREVLDIIKPEQIVFYDMDAPELPVNVKLVDGTEISFSILTLGNYLKLAEVTDSPTWDEIMAAQCVSHSYFDALRILRENASIEDLPVLDKVDQMLYHGIIPIPVECQEISYQEKPDAIIKLKDLFALGPAELRQTAIDAGVGFDENIKDVKSMRNALIFALDLAEMKPCGEKRNVTLGSGEGMIVGDSFRESRGHIDDSISFGKKSEHPAEREPETAV